MAGPARRPRRVLLVTGALSPVHLGHVALLDRAAAAVEARGLDVVGGLLSPSHDGYVLPKLHGDPFALPAARRVELARLALSDHPWASVATWESEVEDGWPDFPEVAAALEAALADRWGPNAPGVVYVCGSDHYAHARLRGLSEVCVVARAEGLRRPVLPNPSGQLHVASVPSSDPLAGLSSSAIRAAAARGDAAELRAGLHPAVAAALFGV